MGVHGLTSFIDSNPKFLKDHKLHDTKVLIDGNNLYYFLYYNYFDINMRYGGDYDCYAQSVEYYFNTLRTCSITPYVVFDGGADLDERKLKTTIKRQADRLKHVKNLANGQKGVLLPLMAYDVFRNVLDELGVKHMTCDFEADDQLAALAKHMNIPVMSNDSDFFVYDLPAGFILFDYINLDVQVKEIESESYKYINVQLYKLENLLKHYKGLQKELIPIVATLSGNDFVESEQFENFFAKAKLPKSFYTNGPRLSSKQRKIAALFMWLESYENLESAVETIVSFFPVRQQDYARGIIDKSIRSYNNLKSTFLTYFEDDKDTESKPKTALKTYGGNLVPYWFVTQLRKGQMPLSAINSLTLHRVFLMQQVELLTEPSTHKCSQSIRQKMYSIMLSLDKELNKHPPARRERRPKENYIEEHDREERSIKVEHIEIISDVPDSSQVPFLQDIPKLDMCEREQIFLTLAGLDIDALMNTSKYLRFLVVAICFWIKNASPKVSVHYLYALIGVLIKLMFLSLHRKDFSVDSEKCSPNVNDKQCDNTESECRESQNETHSSEEVSKEISTDTRLVEFDKFRKQIFLSCSSQEIETSLKNYEKFTFPTTHSVSNKFLTIITHNFSQFQTCYQSLMHLNFVLLCPMFCPSPSLVLNGTVLYNLCSELERRSNPKTYIAEILGLKSPMSGLYFEIVETVLKIVRVEDFRNSDSKIKLKKKSKNKVKENLSEEEKDSDTENKDELDASCMLNNRFSGLLLVED